MYRTDSDADHSHVRTGCDLSRLLRRFFSYGDIVMDVPTAMYGLKNFIVTAAIDWYILC